MQTDVPEPADEIYLCTTIEEDVDRLDESH